MNHQLLEERAQVIIDLIRTTSSIYFHPETNEGQKGLYETLAGAGLWYLPSGLELFSGLISQDALESVEKTPTETKLVEEHSFPRKVGGRYLYEKYREKGESFTKKYFLELYKTKLGKYNLVLKKENDKLKKFQKVKKGTNREEFFEMVNSIETLSYSSAGIHLCEFSSNRYAKFKKSKSKSKRKKEKTS
jgi:hypothetical protein